MAKKRKTKRKASKTAPQRRARATGRTSAQIPARRPKTEPALAATDDLARECLRRQSSWEVVRAGADDTRTGGVSSKAQAVALAAALGKDYVAREAR
jgi:hypothetical protein